MRRAISIVPAVLAVMGALILIMGQPNSVFSGNPSNCHDRIVGKNGELSPRTYNCQATDEFGNTDGMKLEFRAPTPPPGSEDLEVVINDSVEGTCACLKKGKNGLEKNRRFRCIMDNVSIGDNTSEGDFEVLGSTIEGFPNKAGTKINRGQGVDEFGTSIIYSCEEATP